MKININYPKRDISGKNYLIDGCAIWIMMSILSFLEKHRHMNGYIWIFIFGIISIVYVVVFARILKRIFRNVFNISGNLLNFCMISLGIIFIILGIGNLSNSKVEVCGMFVTLGIATTGWGINNIVKEYDAVRVAGDRRKSLYQLEQKENYMLNDLYCLNSYINPYSSENETFILVNKVILTIFNNHIAGERSSDKYKKLKEELTSYLKNGNQKMVTAFDYGIKRNENSVKIYNLNNHSYQDDNGMKNGTLNPMESNLVRLCCHLLLKADWGI